MGFFAVGGKGGVLHGFTRGLVPSGCTAGLGKDTTGVLESWGCAGEGVRVVLVVSEASGLGVVRGC